MIQQTKGLTKRDMSTLCQARKDWGVYIGEALPLVPKKLAEHIWQGEFIEMGELLPETWNFKPGNEANQ